MVKGGNRNALQNELQLLQHLKRLVEVQLPGKEITQGQKKVPRKKSLRKSVKSASCPNFGGKGKKLGDEKEAEDDRGGIILRFLKEHEGKLKAETKSPVIGNPRGSKEKSVCKESPVPSPHRQSSSRRMKKECESVVSQSTTASSTQSHTEHKPDITEVSYFRRMIIDHEQKFKEEVKAKRSSFHKHFQSSRDRKHRKEGSMVSGTSKSSAVSRENSARTLDSMITCENGKQKVKAEDKLEIDEVVEIQNSFIKIAEAESHMERLRSNTDEPVPTLEMVDINGKSTPKNLIGRISFTGRILTDEELKLRAELREIRNNNYLPKASETKKNTEKNKAEKNEVPSMFRDHGSFKVQDGLITIGDDAGAGNDLVAFQRAYSSRMSKTSQKPEKHVESKDVPDLFRDNGGFQLSNGLITLGNDNPKPESKKLFKNQSFPNLKQKRKSLRNIYDAFEDGFEDRVSESTDNEQFQIKDGLLTLNNEPKENKLVSSKKKSVTSGVIPPTYANDDRFQVVNGLITI